MAHHLKRCRASVRRRDGGESLRHDARVCNRRETGNSEEFVGVDVLVGERRSHHVVGASLHFERHAIQIRVYVAGVEVQRLTWLQSHVVHEQSDQRARVVVVLVELPHRIRRCGGRCERFTTQDCLRCTCDTVCAHACGQVARTGNFAVAQCRGVVNEPAQRFERRHRHDHFRLGAVVGVHAVLGIVWHAGLLFARKTLRGLLCRRVRLQRERLCRGEQLHDEREVAHFVHQIRRCRKMHAVVDLCLAARVGAVPNFGPWSAVGGDVEQRRQCVTVAPRIVLRDALQKEHDGATRMPR